MYKIFEGLTSDYVPYNMTTRSGYTGGYLFADLATGMPGRNPLATPLRVLQTDFDTVVHSEEMTLFLEDKHISDVKNGPLNLANIY